MIAKLDPQPQLIQRRSPNLILHCGASHVGLDEVHEVRTPRSTDSWCPIPHHQLITTVSKDTRDHQTFASATRHIHCRMKASTTSPDGSSRPDSSDDYCWVLGLRNSHDKSLPAGIVAGASVFVCDNLSFSGEIKFARKHTRFIVRDLPQLVSRSIGLLLNAFTESLKNGNLAELPKRTEALHGLLDTHVGLLS